MVQPVFRFAPSPNGALHLGHALSAITGWRMAQKIGGRFKVRIEDIDTTRARDAHVEAIFRDLAWLGLDWAEPVLFQSARFAAYKAAAAQLSQMGLLYPSFASRMDIAAAVALDAAPRLYPRDPDGAPIYPPRLRRTDAAVREEHLARGEPHALRLDMERALEVARQRLGGRPLTFTEIDDDGDGKIVSARPEAWGDAVIMRKETPASYTIAVVVDDAFEGISHVTRGRDLFAATDLQRLLQVLLGLPEPLYHHHRLILDDKGAKLSKSAGSRSLAVMRDEGATPGDIWRLLGCAAP